jgi:hypothetical protein
MRTGKRRHRRAIAIHAGAVGDSMIAMMGLTAYLMSRRGQPVSVLTAGIRPTINAPELMKLRPRFLFRSPRFEAARA